MSKHIIIISIPRSDNLWNNKNNKKRSIHRLLFSSTVHRQQLKMLENETVQLTFIVTGPIDFYFIFFSFSFIFGESLVLNRRTSFGHLSLEMIKYYCFPFPKLS